MYVLVHCIDNFGSVRCGRSGHHAGIHLDARCCRLSKTGRQRIGAVGQDDQVKHIQINATSIDHEMLLFRSYLISEATRFTRVKLCETEGTI